MPHVPERHLEIPSWLLASRGLAVGTANDLTLDQGFNPAGQIVTQTRSNDAYAFTGSFNLNRNYTVNGLNQYTAAGPASFAYDANGNLTSDGSSSFTYDIENRLVSATGAVNATLSYDPLGRLFQVVGPTTNTRFLYDGDEIIAEYDAAGTMARRYVHSDAADDPVVQYDGAAVGAAYRTYLMPDERGSIAGLFYDNGTSRAKNSYDEYGIPGPANQGRFQYTGQAWIPELGMYHYKARLYSPTLGRFLQVDPVGYDDQINLYAYVGDDPINSVDPDGQEVEVIRNENKVHLIWTIAYYGEGNTKAVRQKFNQGIVKNWSGQKGRYDVRVTVRSFTFAPGTSPAPGIKQSNPMTNFINIPAGDGRANVDRIKMRDGSWPADRPDWTPGHEAGHLAHLIDRYDEVTGVPNSGFGNSIMGARNKPANEGDITRILKVDEMRGRRPVCKRDGAPNCPSQ